MPYGVSNSCKRGIMKTYTSRQARSIAPAGATGMARQTRITMDARGFIHEEVIGSDGQRRKAHRTSPEPSSPAASAQSQHLFSDVEQLTSESPPSSPPHHRASSPAPKTHKPTFRSLKRKRRSTGDQPLGELSDSNVNTGRPSKAKASKRTRYTQMQIDLGKSSRTTCRGCGMEYVPSSREDERLHKDFHSMNEAGVDLGTGFAKDAHTVERFGFGEVVAMLDARSPLTLQRRVKRVLEVVRTDLGAVEIDEDALWGRNVPKQPKQGSDGAGEDRYKLLVYLAGDKCVGLCLAERLRHASKVVSSQPRPVAVEVDPSMLAENISHETSEPNLPDSTPSALHTEISIAPVLIGISRMWVSRSHRRKGIARTLLEAARQNFFYGIEVPRDMVAFSQPTESGRQLAEDWFGSRLGWHVYAEA